MFLNIAIEKDDILSDTQHMEIDPINMLSVIASLTPFSDFNQSPRNMYVILFDLVFFFGLLIIIFL